MATVTNRKVTTVFYKHKIAEKLPKIQNQWRSSTNYLYCSCQAIITIRLGIGRLKEEHT